MPKPICVPCGLFFKPKKTGIVVEERMPRGGVLDGTETWHPYKLWLADLHECRKCGTEVVVGFGQNPLAEHFQKEEYAKWSPFIRVVVNDC